MVGKLLRGAAALALAAFTLAPAQAASVALGGWAFGGGNVVDTSLYDGAAGGFSGRYTLGGAGTTNFIAYSVQFSEPVVFSKSLLAGYALQDGESYFGADKAGQLARLATWLDQNPGHADDASESTSLQLAIWNIVYDTDNVLGSGSFVDQGSYAPEADVMLAGAQQTAQPTFRVFVLAKAGVPDLLLVQRIPEPGSLALAALALAGLGGARRYAGRRST